MSMRNPPQRRRSLGPVSPKRIYRNLSVRLRGGESSVAGEVDTAKHLGKSTDAVRPSVFLLKVFFSSTFQFVSSFCMDKIN